ncbi:MAG: glycosyltransferase family 9 protein, partial [Candidatus Omnitrophica bacterium]|nr:glycosyltransferase family 9 protein [Candidatus Omnitrophota bacterium]
MKRILVINVNWLGDVIFSIPVFKALRQAYPQARIVCMAVPRVREVLECVEAIDDIIEYDEKGRHWTPWGKLGLIIRLRREKFDTAFLLHGSKTRALLASWAAIPQRIGYDTKGRSKYLTKAIPVPKESLHRSEYYLRVIEEAGIKAQDKTPGLKISEKAKEEVKELLSRKGIAEPESFIVINPGGNWDLKQWPKE